VNHGPYSRSEFSEKVSNIAPDIAAVLSIWPETYCHTLTECWATGLPVLGLDFGAVGDRIKHHNGGWLLDNNIEEIYSFLCDLLERSEEIDAKKTKVLEWQEGYGANNDIYQMASSYLTIYRKLLNRAPAVNDRRIAGLVMKGIYPDVPPTAYVRLVDQAKIISEDLRLETSFLSWQQIVRGELHGVEKVVIQRDAIPLQMVNIVIDCLKQLGIDYIYEIDDDLLSVPPSNDTSGVYKAYKPYFEMLLRNASSVRVSTPALQKRFSEFNANLNVFPNIINLDRWDPEGIASIDLGLNSSVLNIIYFGSRSHQDDLDFLIEVLDKLNSEAVIANLYVVGCGAFSQSEYIKRLSPAASRYDKFVEWLMAVRSNFDVGVAPLIDSHFSVHKSYLKAIEYHALDLAALCSNVRPYNEINMADYPNVVLVDNDLASWCDSLTKYALNKSEVN